MASGVTYIPSPITGPTSASFAIGRLRSLGKARAEAAAVVEAERARVDALEAELLTGIDEETRCLTQALVDWARSTQDDDAPTAVHLPGGRVEPVHPEAAFTITNLSSFLAWLSRSRFGEYVTVDIDGLSEHLVGLPDRSAMTLDPSDHPGPIPGIEASPSHLIEFRVVLADEPSPDVTPGS